VHTRSQLTIVLNATAGGVGKEDIGDRLANLFGAQRMEVAVWFAHISRKDEASGSDSVSRRSSAAPCAGEGLRVLKRGWIDG
jgi:hypothetical protein